jgi:hypothetical protein
MVNPEQFQILKQGVEAWHAWRAQNRDIRPDLSKADLTGADLSEGLLHETVFGNTNLTAVRGLETCLHDGPSILDHRTIATSGPLPLAFLRGCGLPDALIDYLPSLLNEPFQFYSCFISYASRDQATVMTLDTGWPALIRNTRNIGDFRRWKTHDAYQKAFGRLLRDLTAEAKKPGAGASQR